MKKKPLTLAVGALLLAVTITGLALVISFPVHTAQAAQAHDQKTIHVVEHVLIIL